MNRRELIGAILPLAGIPLLDKGSDVGRSFKVESNAKYEVFVNGDMVDVEAFCKSATNDERGLPPGTPIHVVYLNSNQTMDDAVRIYKVDA